MRPQRNDLLQGTAVEVRHLHSSGVYLLVGALFLLNLLVGEFDQDLWFLQGIMISPGLAAVPFAVIGLIGIRNMQKQKVHIYSVYKQIETPVLICYELIQNAVVCHYGRYEDLHISCDRINCADDGSPCTVQFVLHAYCVECGFMLAA